MSLLIKLSRLFRRRRLFAVYYAIEMWPKIDWNPRHIPGSVDVQGGYYKAGMKIKRVKRIKVAKHE